MALPESVIARDGIRIQPTSRLCLPVTLLLRDRLSIQAATCTGDKCRSCLSSRRSFQTRNDGVLAPRIPPLQQNNDPCRHVRPYRKLLLFFCIRLASREVDRRYASPASPGRLLTETVKEEVKVVLQTFDKERMVL